MTPVSITVNGRTHNAEVEPRTLLVHYLRDTLGLTGTHIGCDTSQCGACVVHVNGQSVKSCTLLTVQCQNTQVTTIEGLAQPPQLHPLQEGFWERHGLQCGFCTPGMIMSATDLLQRNANPTDDDIRHGLEGNLCRCTGYENIVRAVQYAAAKMRGEDPTVAAHTYNTGETVGEEYIETVMDADSSPQQAIREGEAPMAG